MRLVLLSAGAQVSAAFTPELVSPLGAAPSAWTHQLRPALCVCLPFQDSKHPEVGELQRLWVLSCFCFVSASVRHRTVILHSPGTQCATFSFLPACLPAALRPSSGRPPVWSNVLSETHSASARQLLWSSPCRYSYGKAVQGTMRVTLCQKARRRPQNASKDICREYSGPVSQILEDAWVVKEHHTELSVKG